jgi:hypothetical protein
MAGTPCLSASTRPCRRVVTTTSIRRIRASTSPGVRKPEALATSSRVSISTTAAGLCKGQSTSRLSRVLLPVSIREERSQGSTWTRPITGNAFMSTAKARSARRRGIRCLKAGLVGRFDRSLLARHHDNRSLSEFRNDARDQGAATVVLHRLHPDVLGPVDPSLSTAGAPRSARWLIRLSRLPRFHDVTSAAVASSVRLLARSHASSLQVDAVKLLARMEHQHGLHTELGREAREQISAGETRAAAPGD